MKYTDKDTEMFRQLSQNATGKWLADIIERMIADMFQPGNVNRENVDAKNEAAKTLLQLTLLIKTGKPMPSRRPGEYE